MIKVVVSLLFIFATLLGNASTKIQLSFPESEVKQGSLVKAMLSVDVKSVQNFETQKLKGQTLQDELYFYNITPLVRKEGSDTFEAEARVIFAKVPQKNSVTAKVGSENVVVEWSSVKIIPTEAEKDFIFASFSIPEKFRFLTYALVLIFLIAVSLLGLKFYKKAQIKKAFIEEKRKQKTALLAVANFEEVVEIWKGKHQYIQAFPHTEPHFKELEKVLFKYQFKPQQSQEEKDEVVKAYRQFKSGIEGGFNGI